MDLKSFTDSLKVKYEDFVSTLEDKGVPHARLVVPLVALLVVAGLVFVVLSSSSISSYGVKVIDLNTSAPIQGANVSVFSNGVLVASGLTDSNGNAVFNLTSGSYTISATSSNYLSSSSVKLVPGAVVQLQSSIPPSMNVVVSVLQNGQPQLGQFITLSFSDGTSVNGNTNINGNASIQVPESELSNGATVSVDGNSIPVSSSALSSGLVLVNLTSSSQPSAMLYVSVESPSGTPVGGAQVSVLSSSTQSVLANGFTDSTGSASFNISVGSSVYVTASASGYGSGSSNNFVFNSSQRVVVQLSTVSASSNLTLSVLDENSNLVSGATVTVFTMGNNQVFSQATQGAPLQIPLASGVYYANVQYSGYLPAIVENLRAGMVKSVSLTPLTTGNYANVSVLVLQDGSALPGASVSFYTSDGLFLFNGQSDGNGMVEAALPLTLNSQPYSFYVNGSYNSLLGESDVFQIGNDNVSLPLSAPPAQLKVSIVDFASKAAVTGFVNVVVGGNIINTCNGTSCVLNVPGGSAFNLNVQASGYLPFTSSVLTYASGSLNSLTVPLYPLGLVSGASASFVGLYDSNGNRVLQVVNGMTYDARFLVNMPESVQSAGFYVRVGEEGNSSTDPAFITGYTPASFIQTGSVYPQDCTSGDNPSSQAKWLLWSFPQGFTGSKEVDVRIQLSLNSSASTPIVLYYKAFGQLSNGLSVYSPVNTALTQGNFSLSAACNSTDFSQTLPFSSNPLTCSVINNHEFCYSMSFSSNGFSSLNFNPTLGQQFQVNLNVLSDVGINGLTLYAPNFKISQNSFSPASSSSSKFSENNFLSFQSSDLSSLTASSTDIGSLLQNSQSSTQSVGTLIPFAANANQLSTLSLSLTPITPTVYAPLSFNFQADDGSQLSFSQNLNIQGTGTLNVQVSPNSWTAPGNIKGKMTITDGFGNPVSDATVSLTECYGSPFNGNPPAVNSQGNGVYSFQGQLFGGGIVGVSVQDQGFKNYDSCSVPVQEQSFLSVNPSSLTFSGDSLNPISQQVTVSNLLNNPVKVSAIVNCYSGSNIFSAIPPYLTLPASGSNQIAVNVVQNSSGNAQCVLDVVGVDGNSRDSEQVQLSGSVSCPECVLNQQIAYELSNLPSMIALYPAGPQTVGQTVYGFNSIPVNFPTVPTCSLSLTQGGGAFPFSGSMYPGVAISPTGSQLVQYGCQTCSSNGDGSFNCNNCQSGYPSAFSCEICQPSENYLPSTYQNNLYNSNPGYLVLWPSASCSSCISGGTVGVVASGVASTNGLISLPVSQQQFFGNVFSGNNIGMSGMFGIGGMFGQQGQASCTANQIQVSAALNPYNSISGTLTLTFSNGMTAQIPVVGPAAGILGFSQIANATPQENCNFPNLFTVNLYSNLSEQNSTTANINNNCNIQDSNINNYYFQGNPLNGNFGCKFSESNNVLSVQNCDFSSSSDVASYYINKGNVDDLNASSTIGVAKQGQKKYNVSVKFTIGNLDYHLNVFNDSDALHKDYCGGVLDCPASDSNGKPFLNVSYGFPQVANSQQKFVTSTFNGQTSSYAVNDLQGYLSIPVTTPITQGSVYNLGLNVTQGSTSSRITTCAVTVNPCSSSPTPIPSQPSCTLSQTSIKSGSTENVNVNALVSLTTNPASVIINCGNQQSVTANCALTKNNNLYQGTCSGMCSYTLTSNSQTYSINSAPGGGATCAPLSINLNSNGLQPNPSTYTLAFYQQFDVGDFKNNLFSLLSTSQLTAGDNGRGYVLLTPSTKFVVYSTNPAINAIALVPASDSTIPSSDCSSNQYLNCWNKFNGGFIYIPAYNIFSGPVSSSYSILPSTYEYPSNQAFNILIKENSGYLYISSLGGNNGYTTSNSAPGNLNGVLVISPDYLGGTTGVINGNSKNYNIYSSCATPSANSIGNVWVFKTTADSSLNLQNYVPGSFDIISTNSGSLKTSQGQNVYLYGCLQSGQSGNAVAITSNIQNLFSVNPLITSNSLHKNSEGSYEFFQQLSMSLPSNGIVEFNLKLTPSGSSRYYCHAWPVVLENCDGISKDSSIPQQLSVS